MKIFRVFLKTFLMTDRIKFEISHSAKNCLDIETDSDEEEVEADEIETLRKTKRKILDLQSKKAVMSEFYDRQEVKKSSGLEDSAAARMAIFNKIMENTSRKGGRRPSNALMAAALGQNATKDAEAKNPMAIKEG